jgi:hypothetical protein
MKKLKRKPMNKILFIALTLFSNIAFSGTSVGTPIGRITEVTGAGFISSNGSTHEAKKGEMIYDKSEIVVEHKGRITITDNHDHRFHLGNSSSAYYENGALVLRSGDMWIQSIDKTNAYTLKTANAAVSFDNGEAIVTYDGSAGKTQLMVINGMMKFSNVRVPDLNLSVAEGNFSYVSNSYEEGAPRDPTPVGDRTYKELLSIFPGVTPMSAEGKLAANHHVAAPANHHGAETMTEVHTTIEPKQPIARSVAAIHEPKKDDLLIEEYKNSMLENKSHRSVSKAKKVVYSEIHKKKEVVSSSPAPVQLKVQIYGLTKEKVSSRMPASVVEAVAVVNPQVETSSSVIDKTLEKFKNKAINNDSKVPTKETENLIEKLNAL